MNRNHKHHTHEAHQWRQFAIPPWWHRSGNGHSGVFGVAGYWREPDDLQWFLIKIKTKTFLRKPRPRLQNAAVRSLSSVMYNTSKQQYCKFVIQTCRWKFKKNYNVISSTYALAASVLAEFCQPIWLCVAWQTVRHDRKHYNYVFKVLATEHNYARPFSVFRDKRRMPGLLFGITIFKVQTYERATYR